MIYFLGSFSRSAKYFFLTVETKTVLRVSQSVSTRNVSWLLKSKTSPKSLMMKTIGDRRRRRCNFILEDNEDYVLASFEE
jgi:hypothetical protein